jgi:hypothetical protein
MAIVNMPAMTAAITRGRRRGFFAAGMKGVIRRFVQA